MLRDCPPYDRDEANDGMYMTGTPGIVSDRSDVIDPLDDVFGSAPASPTLRGNDDYGSRMQGADPSDIPRLRSTHVTSGYREGITSSKEKHMQEGFDEGYSLGAELGLKAGSCLGSLSGIWHALRSPAQERISQRERVGKMLQQAEQELSLPNLFGRAYFDVDGLWTYDITASDGAAERETASFQKIAEAHPLIQKWRQEVHFLSGELRLTLQ